MRQKKKTVSQNQKIIARQNVFFHAKIKRIENKENKKKGVKIRHYNLCNFHYNQEGDIRL